MHCFLFLFITFPFSPTCHFGHKQTRDNLCRIFHVRRQPKVQTCINTGTVMLEGASPLHWTHPALAESLSHSALFHCLDSVLLTTICAIILWSTCPPPTTKMYLWIGQFIFYKRSVVTLERKINSETSRTWSAESPHALHGNPWYSSEIGVWVWSVSKTNCGPTVLWRDNYCGKLFRSFE